METNESNPTKKKKKRERERKKIGVPT